MEADGTLFRLPSVLFNPAALESLIKKKSVRRPWAVRRPQLITEADMLPISFQLSREHLDALREEIKAAEPVLHHVYEDRELFNIRENGLNAVMLILLHMRDALDKYPVFEDEKGAVRQGIDFLIEQINLVISQSKYYAIPLLEPMGRVAPFAREERAPANLLDVVFVVSRSPGIRRDIKLLASHIPDFYKELKNFGFDIRLGLQTFGRTSQPAGPMRTSPEEFVEDIYSMTLGADSQNALTAIRNSLDDFNFRLSCSRHFVLLADADAHDDFADAREQTVSQLSDARVVFDALSVHDRFTGSPLMVFDELVRATGGSYINIDRADYRITMSALSSGIYHKTTTTGVPIVASTDRVIPVGPEVNDTISVRFPDFRPAALGIFGLRLDTREDFRIGLMIVNRAISTISIDKVEKRVLQDYLARILTHFDDVRDYRLDFWI